ncbi:putative toxin-antitoxin system toxin component, PIN family [Rhodobacteraceae bacterium M385]|nr:putative toxin-antitoxin system toxin component, PIN family [Rhodobacteraceae bacterium M385]
MRLVLDTNVLVAGIRSRTGASNPLLIAGFRGQFDWACSVPLFYEYEDVLSRADLLLDCGVSRKEMEAFLTDVAGIVQPVDLKFLWRPQLRDPGDEMVLETAVNGQVDALITHNTKDFGTAPQRFGIELWTPADALRRLKS